MQLLKHATVILAILHLATAHDGPLVVVGEDVLNQTIRDEVSAIVQQATTNITTVIMQQATASINSIVEEVKRDLNFALGQAIQEVTDTVEQLLQPLLNESSLQQLPGKTPSNPATSCRDTKSQNPTVLSGYYWIQNSDIPLVQAYCDMDEVEPYLGTVPTHPAISCNEIRGKIPSLPSGYYWVKAGNETPIQVYCNMTLVCNGVSGGWMQVADIDMSNSSHTCPQGLRTLTTPIRMCGRRTTAEPGCVSTTFNGHGIKYTHTCGKIIGYQNRSTDGFKAYIHNPTLTIDDQYLDGVSLTHGSSPRNHIWSFAAAADETSSTQSCPCINQRLDAVPPWVGKDVFCDTGAEERYQNIFYLDDPLWDGEGCGPTSTCCSFNNPPWFSKQLPSPTTDDIEMRLCVDSPIHDEDILIEKVEIYVQ